MFATCFNVYEFLEQMFLKVTNSFVMFLSLSSRRFQRRVALAWNVRKPALDRHFGTAKAILEDSRVL